MPPMATRFGSASVMPLLLRCPPASKRVSLAPPPVGMATRVSMVDPGARSATSEVVGSIGRVAVLREAQLRAAEEVHGVLQGAGVDVAQQHGAVLTPVATGSVLGKALPLISR